MEAVRGGVWIFSGIAQLGHAQQGSYFIHAVFLEYAQIKEAKRLCLQGTILAVMARQLLSLKQATRFDSTRPTPDPFIEHVTIHMIRNNSLI